LLKKPDELAGRVLIAAGRKSVLPPRGRIAGGLPPALC
jgi:hypothetical protein